MYTYIFLYFYQEAVCALNTLQSNATTLAKTKDERDMNRYQSIPDTLNAAAVVGITVSGKRMNLY